MRVRVLLFSAGIFLLPSFIPGIAFADTIVDSDITENTTWTEEGNPYLVQDFITIDKDVTLSIGPGVVVQFDSGTGIDFFGNLLATGTPDAPIVFTSITDNWDRLIFENETISSSLDNIVMQHSSGISDFSSKGLSISNAKIENSDDGIEVYGGSLALNNFAAQNISGDAIDVGFGSDAILNNINLKNVKSGIVIFIDSTASISNLIADTVRNDVITVYEKSSVRVASSTIANVSESYAIEAFNDSSLDITNLTIDGVLGSDALSVFNNSKMTVSDSTISNVDGWEAVSVFNSGSLIVKNLKLKNGSGDGLTVWSGGSVDLQDSVISGFTNGIGVVDYGSHPEYGDPPNAISLTKNEITNNDVGLGFYSGNSSYVISNDSIHNNVSYGLVMYGAETADVRNNFWGDASGPQNDPGNLTGTGDTIFYVPGNTVTFSPWLSYWGTPPPDPCVATNTCYSNVLFLPGIESSRLYRPNYNGGADKLWEPNIDSDVQDLYMNPDGTSKRFDVYTKERDVLDELPDGENIYKSFIGKMDELKTSGTIAGWEPIAYDWRLSLDDILSYGNDIQGRIYYSGDLRATSTPYIIQELKRLAATSKTGKVTIVAHSNGGLLAKRLTEILGPTEASRLIDKMIFVAVPQAGTPAAIAAGLHGYDQENVWGLVTTKSTARTLANAAPMEYQLLPSEKYFTYVDNPVITFDPALTDWISQYGETIHSQERLHKFLIDTFGRVDPQTGDINQPVQFDETLLSDAEFLHEDLDTWIPPTGVQLTQIAGWGIPKTVDGIIYKKKGTGVTPEADLTIDGDGAVVVPSALWTSTTSGAVNYWMDLGKYNRSHPFSSGFGWATYDHSRILETEPVINFISDKITNVTKSLSDYTYLSTEAPISSEKRLRYSLHSPLTLNLYDAVGHHTGISTTTGQVEEQIPGTYYMEFGDVKYIFSDASTDGNIIMNGYDSGTFTFSVDEYNGDTLTTSTTFKDVPTTASTTVTLDVQSGGELSPMVIDENGDGGNVFTLTPKAGETVNYEPPAPTPALQTRSTGSGGRHISIPSIVPTTVATTTSTSSPRALVVAPATTTQPVGIHTPVVVTTKPLLAKKKTSVPIVPSEKVNTNVSQTASVYETSQQTVLQKLGLAVYNGLRGLWVALMKFFY